MSFALAFWNSLALDFAKKLRLSVASPAISMDAKSVLNPQGLFVYFHEKKAHLELLLHLDQKLLSALVSQALGGGFQITAMGSGAISDRLARKEAHAIAQISLGFLGNFFVHTNWHVEILEKIDPKKLEQMEIYRMQLKEESIKASFELTGFASKEFIRRLKGRAEVKGVGNPFGTAILDQIRDSEIELRVILAELMMPLKEICELRSGQVLMLNHKKTDLVKVCVQDRPIFKAQLGTKNARFLIKIVSK